MARKKCISVFTINHDLNKNLSLNKRIYSNMYYGSSNQFREESSLYLKDKYYSPIYFSKRYLLKPIVWIKIAWYWIVHACFWIQKPFCSLFKKINGIRSKMR